MRVRLPGVPWCGSNLPSMEQDTVTLETTDAGEELVDDELLVEEISIDGMCGVY